MRKGIVNHYNDCCMWTTDRETSIKLIIKRNSNWTLGGRVYLYICKVRTKFFFSEPVPICVNWHQFKFSLALLKCMPPLVNLKKSYPETEIVINEPKTTHRKTLKPSVKVSEAFHTTTEEVLTGVTC